MFQAFVVLCLIGQEPSFENCRASLQPTIHPSETLCMNSVARYLNTVTRDGILETFEIHDIGCHCYLTDQDFRT